MHKFGISIYPDQKTLEENIDYIRLASKYGYKRIFTCLISLGDSIESSIEKFKKLIEVANEEAMEVIADVTPDVFNALGLDYQELGFFNDLGLSGIRLDLGFSGIEESIMTANPYGLKIEINISTGTKYLENILSYQPKKENLYGCHNFYPHEYTGLSREHFMMCSKQFKDHNIRTAAFVNAPSATFGPWPTTEGLCTLEEHRHLEIAIQGKDLIHNGLIDDVIIANCYASENELKTLSEVNTDVLTMGVILEENISVIEEKIVTEELHFYRGDISDYVIRSTQPRVKYKEKSFPSKNTRAIKKGDLLIDNDLYKRYAGELQIALKDRPNNGKTNIVGKISPNELFLLSKLRPWQKFRLKSV
jgi:hypothetical protein